MSYLNEECLICVAKDDDRHFQAARIDDREEVLFILKTISTGQFYEEWCFDNDLEPLELEDVHTIEREEWISYLRKFETRSQFEIINL